jgi:hypothetical protein
MSNEAHVRIAAWGKVTTPDVPATTPVLTPAVTTWVHPDAARLVMEAYNSVREEGRA